MNCKTPVSFHIKNNSITVNGKKRTTKQNEIKSNRQHPNDILNIINLNDYCFEVTSSCLLSITTSGAK